MIEYLKKEFLSIIQEFKLKKFFFTIYGNIILLLLIVITVTTISYMMTLHQIKIFYTIILASSSTFLARCIYKNFFKKNKLKIKNPSIFFISFFICFFISISFANITSKYDKKNPNIPLIQVTLQKRFAYKIRNFDQSLYTNTKLYKSTDIPLENTYKIHKMLENTYKKSKEIYDYIPKYEAMIVVNHKDNKNFKDKSLFGFYSRNNKIIHLAYDENIFNNIPQIFEQNLSHEFNHYVLDMFFIDNQIDIQKIPTWFNEGLSEYLAFGNSKNNNSINYTNNLQNLINSSKWNELKNDASHYAQSHYFICDLVNKYGKDIIKNILIDCKTLEFEDAFEKNVGTSLFEYIKIFTNGLITHFNIKNVI